MGTSKLEEINNAVTAVLKTLECSICLELLKSPVSAKCGHFFCKDCISNVLSSNYRAPCPLCKRSFTRRGIQEAKQRASIICAAKKIAESCQKLTGASYFSRENSQDISSQCDPKCVEESPVLDASEKIKLTFFESDVKTRKRKSSEKDAAVEKVSGECVQDVVLDSADDDTLPSAKKVHFQPENAEEFPSLENLLEESILSAKEDVLESEKREKESAPVTLPEKRDIIVKKYSRTKYFSKTSENLFQMLKGSSEDKKSTSLEETTSKGNTLSSINSSEAPACSPKQQVKNFVIKRKLKSNLRDLKLKDRTNIKNAINTLRSKSNKVDLLKKNNIVEVSDLTDVQKVKENENSILFQNASSTPKTALSARKRGRPRKIRKESPSEEGNLNQVSKEKEVSNPNKMDIEVTETNALQNQCYNLNEISISDSSILDHDQIKKSGVKVLLQDVCLPDTAVSVYSITSPPANKSVSLHKSPGWSRVKQDGKDFRVKTFSALDVAKNSPGLISNEMPDCVENDSTKGPKPKFVPISHDLRSEVSPKELDKHLDSSSEQKKDQSVCEGVIKKQNENHSISETLSENERHSEDGSSSVECCNSSRSKKSIDGSSDECNKQNVHSNQSVPSIMQCSVKLIKWKIDSRSKSDHMCEDNLAHDLQSSRIVNETPLVLPHSKADEMPNETETSPTRIVFDELNIQETERVNQNLPESREQLVNYESSSNDEHLQMVTELEQPMEKENKANLMPVSEQVNCGDYVLAPRMDAEIDDVMDDLEFAESIHSIIRNEAPNQHSDPIVEPKQSTTITNFHTFTNKNDISDVQTSGLTKKDEIRACEITLSPAFTNKCDDDVKFLEHSQQTSQSLFNYNVGKNFDVYNGVAQNPFSKYSEKKCHSTDFKYPAFPNRNPYICTVTNVQDERPVSKPQKTKVMKRTCFTLEEIQDSFLKSSLSGQTETICSIPFLAGEFKLNISVAEETLNVSVVKVIDEASENGSLTNKNLVSEKGIQTSAYNSPASSQASIIPSSNVESETSLLENSDKVDLEKEDTEPFPYLSEKSLENHCVNSLLLTVTKAEEVNEVTESNFCKSALNDIPHDENSANTKLNNSNPDCFQDADHMHLNANVADIPEQCTLNKLQSNNKMIENNVSGDKFSESKVSSSSNIQNKESNKYVGENVQSSPTMYEKTKPSLEKCTSEEQLSTTGESSDEYDPYNLDTFRVPACVQISDDSDNQLSDPDMAYASKLVAPLMNLGKKKRMLEKKGTPVKDGSPLAYHSENSNVKSSIFSKDNSITDSNAATGKKQSRLSLKSKNSHKKFKRIQNCESSDESESEELSVKDHSMRKDLSSAQHQTTSFQSPKSSLLNIQQSLPKNSEANFTRDVPDHQDAAETLLTAPNETVDEHSTLNSILSDEIKDADPNQIVMEIEDLDSKIKMLEAKLKQCGHAETLKQNSSLNKTKEPSSTHKDENNADDNEDSIDLFAESIPPTPPEALS